VIATADLDRALEVLARGHVVAAATETYFGLLADARATAAIDRVVALKGQTRQRGIALLLPDRGAWVHLVVEISEGARRIADSFWPGPLTVALPAQGGLDARLVVDGAVAVRLPGPSDAALIASAFGAPLTATSANRTGEAPATGDHAVRAAFDDEVFVVPGTAPGGAASTVVRVDGASIRLLRAGPIGFERIERAFRSD
jgi:L-threonylcarbamoyladenylate synthase